MINITAIRPRAFFRHSLPVVALVVCCTLLWQRLILMDMDAIRGAITTVTWDRWLAATAATWLSFRAIGRYDAIWHEVMQTGVAPREARQAGARAIAIAQMLGFGAVTASLVRWRCLPTLSLWQATRLSVAVTFTFTLCWAAYGLIATWWLGNTPVLGQLTVPQVMGLLIVGGLAAIATQRTFAPNLRIHDIGRLLFWTAFDMASAALALYILLPGSIMLSFDVILAAYVIALGIGLISNAPGGVGAFDLALLALLPLSSQEPLVAGIIAFRIIYYLVPAVVAIVAIARPQRHSPHTTSDPSAWGLAAQSGTRTDIAGQPWKVGKLPFVLSTLGPAHPFTANAPKLAKLRQHAMCSGRIPALYNCDGRVALAARKAGWFVRRTAMEAIIRPSTWSTEGRKAQALRRKLRNAATSGIRVIPASTDLPITEMTAIARQWAQFHGGELGFSMGRYCPSYIARQRVFLIYDDIQLVGFVSFHSGLHDWSLDLIRHQAGIPDGAIHTAIVAAITCAKAEKIHRVSLCAVPDPRHTPAFWSARRAGLTQFKRTFGPIWVPRYHAAPTRFGFWFTGLIIGLAVYRPIANIPCKVFGLWVKFKSRQQDNKDHAPAEQPT